MAQSQRTVLVLVPGNEPLRRPGIYVIQHNLSGRRYVGISGDVARRIGEHARGRGGSGRLQDAIKADGAGNFTATPIYYSLGTAVGLAAIEAKLIASYDSIENGYNTTAQGRGAGPYGPVFKRLLKEAINKPGIKEARAATNALPETRARRTAALLKSHNDPEFRARLSAIHKALGAGSRLNTPEVRAKLSAIRQSPEARTALSKRMLSFYSNPESKAKHLRNVRLANANPKRNEKISSSRKGLRWITNGVENRAIREGQPPEGWRFGKTLWSHPKQLKLL